MSEKDKKIEEVNLNPNGTEPPKEGDIKIKKHLAITFLLSLLAAFVLWIVAVDYDVEDYEKTFNNVTVQLVGQSELFNKTGMQVRLDGDIKLSIVASGKRSILSSIDSSSFTATIDVSALSKEGKSDALKINVGHVNGITIVSQSVSYATVITEKTVAKTFEIIPLLGQAQLENGVSYTLICDTESVTVTGSESVINSIKRAVAYVNPEPKNVTESFKSHCLIVLESDFAIDESSLKLSLQYCSVNVVLKKEKSVPIKIKLDGANEIEYGTSFHTAVSGVLLEGEPKVIDGIEYANVSVSYEKIKNQLGSGKTSFTIKGVLELPDGITEKNGVLETDVEVKVSTKAETVLGSEINVVNCPLGYTVEVGDVEIMLKGLFEELEQINDSSFKVTLDLKNVNPSTASQQAKAEVSIENANSVIYETQCLVDVKFLKK